MVVWAAQPRRRFPPLLILAVVATCNKFVCTAIYCCYLPSSGWSTGQLDQSTRPPLPRHRAPTLTQDNESNGARLIEAANGRKASRGWCQVVLGGTTGTAAIKRASTQDIMRLRGSKKAATTTPAEAVCCGDDDTDDDDDDDDEANQATP